MLPGTVRLTALSDLTRRPREAIRNAQKAGAAPWDDTQFDEGTQRRYDAFHALGLLLAEALMAQKCSMDLAGEFVRAHALAINIFLDEVTAGVPIIPRFVLGMQRAVEDSWTGGGWEPVLLIGTGTLDEVQREICAVLSSVGNETVSRGGNSTKRIIGGPWIATVSIPEMYRLLKMRAEAAGFIVDGRRIFKVAKEEQDSEAEE